MGLVVGRRGAQKQEALGDNEVERGQPDARRSLHAPRLRTSELGRRVFEGTTTSSNALSVMQRRAHIASLLDEVAGRSDSARVLAVACGHLREAELMRHRERLAAFYALDQDTESLSNLGPRAAGTNIFPTHGPASHAGSGDCDAHRDSNRLQPS
jgi:hypothetical protein